MDINQAGAIATYKFTTNKKSVRIVCLSIYRQLNQYAVSQEPFDFYYLDSESMVKQICMRSNNSTLYPYSTHSFQKKHEVKQNNCSCITHH